MKKNWMISTCLRASGSFRRKAPFFGCMGLAAILCGWGAAGADSPKKTAPSKRDLQETASSPSANPVIAQVGDVKITQVEFLRYLDGLLPGVRAQAASQNGRAQLLQGYIYQKAVCLLARRAGVEQDPEFQRLVNPYIEGQLANLYMDRLRAEVSVSTAEVIAYYDAHPQEFAVGPIHASHIVTKSFEQARKAQDLLSAGRPFGDVARELSIDSATAKNGGRMPPSRSGGVDPVFEQTVRSMGKGQVSWIVNTQAGYELIRKDADIPGNSEPLQIVEAAIARRLRNQKMFKNLEDAKSRLPVTIDEKRLNALDISTRQSSL